MLLETVGSSDARSSGLLHFVPAVLLTIFFLLRLPSFALSLSYLIPAVPIRKCWEPRSCMSFIFLEETLNCICCFSARQILFA